MPDIYMHSRLAEDVISELKEKLEPEVVFLGAQGPDPMYYHVFSKETSTYRYYADRLHDTDTKSYLKEMVRYTKRNFNVYTYSYLVGFLCHYALDVTVHPYVYYNVGVYDENNPKTHAYRGLHLKFERSIDAALIQEELNIKPHKINLTKKYYPLKEAPIEVNELMGHILNKRFNITNGDEIFNESTKVMFNVINRINTDRTGIKKLIYKFIDLFPTKRDMFIQDLSFYNHVEKQYDFLNKQKKTWYHPITNKQYNASVIELYDQAKNFAIDLITKTTKYLSGNNNIDLNKVFTNLSFNSGIDCDHQEPFQYFNIYRR